MSGCCGHPTPVPPLEWDALDTEYGEVESTILRIVGTGPCVIAVPHGGTLRPLSVPDRTSGCVEPDTHTAQLALAIHRSLKRQKNPSLHPSVIIGKLHRIKVDLARPRDSAAESDEGRAAWDEYHGAVHEALDVAVKRHGHAHLVDLHGQCHREASEVGCMLTNRELRVGCRDHKGAEEGGCSVGKMDSFLERSSLSAMSRLESYVGLEDVLRGPKSIGTLLEGAGYPAVPSAETPHPCCGICTTICSSCCVDGANDQSKGKCCSEAGRNLQADLCCEGCQPCTGFDVRCWRGTKPNGCSFGPCSFFWGGYACMSYGGGRTDDCGQSTQIDCFRNTVAATQIETQWKGCRETVAQIELFSEAIAGAIVGFVGHYYLDLQDEGPAS